ncbi:MAG: HAD family hydrolase [Desulfatiglandales bacterium]
MLELNIPSRGLIQLHYLVLDLNGTIALDGKLLPGVSERVEELRPTVAPWLLSADTQGTLSELAASMGVQWKRLDSGDEARQKLAFVEELGAERVVAFGNGANDAMMLRKAALGIAVMGAEGLATECLTASVLVAPGIESALDLFLYPRRLLATLRR